MPEMRGSELVQVVERVAPELPVLMMSGYTTPMMDDEQRVIERVPLLEKPFSGPRCSAQVRDPVGRPGRRIVVRPSVLVLDDEPAARTMAGRILEPHYDVEVAADTTEARAKLIGFVDLLLCDINLPGESGMDLIQEPAGFSRGEGPRGGHGDRRGQPRAGRERVRDGGLRLSDQAVPAR